MVDYQTSGELKGHTTQLEADGEADSVRQAALTPLLLVLQSPDLAKARREFELDELPLLVGRDVGRKGLNLADPKLSRLHFRIVNSASRYRLFDMNSSNGTFINGRRVQDQYLEPGDIIRAGNSLFLFGGEDEMLTLRRRAARGAASQLTVLIEGETGTGKEVMARFVHDASSRSGAFVAVNCATLPRELIAAELFGHTRRAFSGASEPRAGLFVSAEGGSLFLDEIGELPLEQQPALLRVLQERSVRPLGADLEVAVDVRVIAATNVDLEQAVADGKFRADLYARLANLRFGLPPLRARRREILSLSHTFARGAGWELSLTPDAAECLLLWDWPYNVRELQSLVRTIIATEEGEMTLRLNHIASARPELAKLFEQRRAQDGSQAAALGPGVAPSSRAASSSHAGPSSRGAPSRAELQALLTEHAGNVSQVAKQLGKPRAQVYRWLRGLGLDAEKFRE